MDKYLVKLYPNACQDLDKIYSYIAYSIQEPITANKIIDILEEAIFSLELFPKRDSFRQNGIYANYI